MRRFMLIGGIAGPVLFALVVAVCGALRPEYDPLTRFMSELGETGGAYAPLMNYAGFMLSATLIMGFAISLPARFDTSLSTRLGTVLIAAFAAGMFAAGVFSCDTGCTPEVPTSAQRLHDLASTLAFPSLILATLVWGLHLRRDPAWRRFGLYSLGTGGLCVVLLFAMVASVETRTGTGLLQRLLLGALFLWMALLATRLLREPTRT